MAPKYHPTPLSGGDRKALAREQTQARAMPLPDDEFKIVARGADKRIASRRESNSATVTLTCQIVIPAGQPGGAYLMDVALRLKDDFGIQHATVLVESDPDCPCALAPDHVV